MQQFILASDENAVIQVKFMNSKNENIFIHENEKAEWSSSDSEVLEIVSSQFDGVNYFVNVSAKNVGVSILRAKGWFVSNEETRSGEFSVYEFLGECKVEVKPALVDKATFSISHITKQV